MKSANFEKILEALAERISNLEMDIFIKDITIEQLKKENAQLNEFLNPTKKDGEKNE